MSYAIEKVKVGREPVTFLELDLDFCLETFGVAPCTATAPSGGECFNTRSTCADVPNYNKGTKTYRFVEARANLPVGIDAIPCVVGKPSTSPTKITPGKGLGARGSVTVTLQDFPHHDRGIDPYVGTRNYTPRGTFFGKLIARNRFYQGRIMRLRTGYLTDPFDWGNFSDRVYVIEKIEGPDRNGRVRITGKDILKLADDDRAQCPVPSSGKLSANITDAATSLTLAPAGVGSEYGASGTIRIGDEILTFSSRSGDTLSGLTRATYGTTADAHDTDDLVQLCKVYNQENVVDIINDLLVNFASIDPAYIPYDNGATGTNDEWDDEKADWLGAMTFTTVLSKPEGVTKLLGELSEQGLLDPWWDERAQKIKLKAIAPPTGNSAVTALDDDYHFLADSVKVKEDPKDRVSQVWAYWDVIDWSEGVKAENFRQLYITADLNKESADQYGTKRVKEVLSRWIRSEAQASQMSGRLLARFANTPKTFSFALDAKDEALATGGLINVTTWAIQNTDGSRKTSLLQVLQSREVEPGTRHEFEALSASFEGRYGFIGPNTLGDYSAESEDNTQAHGFIAPDSGTFADGEPAYKII